MTITYATGVGGYSARRFVCTHNDPLCSDSAVVFVLEDGRWYGDALCADHAPTSALRSLAAAEAGKGACTPPPAATEGQGAVPSAAPAPGGSTLSESELILHLSDTYRSLYIYRGSITAYWSVTVMVDDDRPRMAAIAGTDDGNGSVFLDGSSLQVNAWGSTRYEALLAADAVLADAERLIAATPSESVA